ncbi:serine--tRNA ligase [Alkalicaulis satelles]|uniref:Serine--tRNA ligase n=1 Tax=Alkalicaulis satelles TaxID=2609175 RepID=A0A5M6ZIE5_9PROT|nr:serine--tRNA ligase [Alkalicaulis satelles]KAA5804593.1 serine--tRNA ligase [Alkalicaulis satelles]
MHDIRLIRDNPGAFDAAMARRGLTPQAERLIDLDARRREATTRLQELETRRNAASKEIGIAKGRGDNDRFEALRAEVEALKGEMERCTGEAASAEEVLNQALAALPNTPADDVPDGADEHDNEEVRGWGEPRTMDFEPADHVTLGERLGLDFERAAAMSGARFAVLQGPLARLERALGQFMLDMHTTEYGYRETSVPYLVRDDALFGTGQLPKFAEDQFRTTNDFWLIPTAEVPLSNLVREAIHAEGDFPIRLTALTPCFRSEAGSAGRDTRGLIRMHQFHKVELVSITTPEQSDDELERMTGCAEAVLRALELPYRVMALCSGDMGFAARKTYDLEVWLPSQKTYREISSCSNCGDFQARRMNARFRREGEKKPDFLHTLNGSGVAVGRALVAILENHQNADGSVTIPAALRPYMGGVEAIRP